MKNQKKIIFASMFVLLMVMTLIPMIKADVQQVVSEDTGFNLAYWLKSNFNLNLFEPYSIVGDRRNCGDGNYPNKEWSVESGKTQVVYISDWCSSSSGLIDSYTKNGPYKEFKNDISFTCKAENAPCRLELYCCPHPECSSNSQCVSWYGTGSQCKSSTERDDNIYLDFNTWKYCTISEGVTCWYNRGDGECRSRDYSDRSDCPSSYAGYKLYDTKSECQGGSCTNGQKKCSSSTVRATCSNGQWSEYNCASGETCSVGECVSGTNPNPNPNPNLEGKSISLTEDAWGDATGELIVEAMCKLPGDCSNTQIYNIGEGLTSENYTTTCITSTTIKEANRAAIVQYLESQKQGQSWLQQQWDSFYNYFFNNKYTDPSKYAQVCQSTSLPALLGRLSQWFSGTETCKNTLATVPTGTCRATQKTSSISYCQYTQWASLKIFNKTDKCQDGLITMVIGILILMFVIPAIKK